MSFDFHYWSNDTSHVPIDNKRWLFSRNIDFPSDVRFFIFDCPSETVQHRFQLNGNLAIILAYLDLDYFSTFQSGASPNGYRLARYLGKLRDEVVKELTIKDTTQLLDPAFIADCLQHYAIREGRGFGHSSTGRRKYDTYCVEKGLVPYTDDPTKYG
jgi:hypothetical protein